MPADRLRPAIKSYGGARLPWKLGREVSDALRELGRREGATLFMTLLAGFKALLWRYTGQEDLVVGSPVANRSRSEVEGLVGFFVNTLALRTRLEASQDFVELVKEVRRVCLGAYAHQDVPFEKLVEELQPERNLSHTPLFQVMLSVENAPGAEFRLAGVRAVPLEQETGTAKFDLLLSLSEHEGALVGAWEYSTDLFDAATVERMAGQFAVLLEAAATEPPRRLCDLPLLSERERRQLLFEWNETATEYPRSATVQQLFEEQAARTPGAVAVVCGEQSLSYGELDARANRLAHYLRRLGVGPEQPVGICIERSTEMIVALLGILKAGGAYVALDPDYPAERLSLMLKETGAGIVLTQERLSVHLPEGAARLVCLDSEVEEIARESCSHLRVRGDAEQLAYVSYTSGSTGRPKGVCVP
ncbi:MAG TPA: condensation domain-containing protein, partial [Pyrinomonadaceae bacterium]|nr:condensation domain-containing protein [Pyrinomonadaceae bacterium]